MKNATLIRCKYPALAFLALLVGCSTTPQLGFPAAEQVIRTELLSFIADGETTREEVLLKLGKPSGIFEQERILTYQIWVDEAKNTRVFWPRRPQEMAYRVGYVHSLVLVFGSNGVLAKHSLIGAQ
jgi:hypothetical protein